MNNGRQYPVKRIQARKVIPFVIAINGNDFVKVFSKSNLTSSNNTLELTYIVNSQSEECFLHDNFA